jgi:hypothetical protein
MTCDQILCRFYHSGECKKETKDSCPLTNTSVCYCDQPREIKYKAILDLYRYCEKLSIPAMLEDLHDGYAIRFPNGGDFVQHKYSYGAERGCVEPAIGCRVDFSPVSLEKAKGLVRRCWKGRKEKDNG